MTGNDFVGTQGDGIFAAEYTSPFIYDWYLSNAGLSGDALFVNDVVSGDGFAMLATNNGFYKAVDGDTEWIQKNAGLSGDALKVNSIVYLGAMLIATDGGLYYSLDLAENWGVAIPDEKLNIAFYINTEISPSGFMVFAFGENGFYTETMETWTQMDFGGMEGEVTAAQSDGENLYIGFTIPEKNGKGNGGLYKKPLEQFIVGLNENSAITKQASLQQNYPNPFIGSTNISYTLNDPGFVSLQIFDLLGREVKDVVNEHKTSGGFIENVNLKDFTPNIYYYTLKVNNVLVDSKKMILK